MSGMVVGWAAFATKRQILAEVGLRSANASAALKELTALQRDVAARGFGFMAQKASKLVSANRP